MIELSQEYFNRTKSTLKETENNIARMKAKKASAASIQQVQNHANALAALLFNCKIVSFKDLTNEEIQEKISKVNQFIQSAKI
jgi:hypothetical protein